MAVPKAARRLGVPGGDVTFIMTDLHLIGGFSMMPSIQYFKGDLGISLKREN
jgi:hypothetical protein